MSQYNFNHVHIYTNHVEETVSFYIKTFGAKELRRSQDLDTSLAHVSLGNIRIVISQATQEHPPGIGHFAIGSDSIVLEDAKGDMNNFDATNINYVKLVTKPEQETKLYGNFFIKDPSSGVAIEIISPLTT